MELTKWILLALALILQLIFKAITQGKINFSLFSQIKFQMQFIPDLESRSFFIYKRNVLYLHKIHLYLLKRQEIHVARTNDCSLFSNFLLKLTGVSLST